MQNTNVRNLNSVQPNEKIVGETITLMGSHPFGSEFQANTVTHGCQQGASLTIFSDAKYIISWSGEGSLIEYGIYGQLYNSDNAKSGSQLSLATRINNPDNSPSGRTFTALSNNNFVTAWKIKNDNDPTDWDLYGQIFNETGVAQGPIFSINTYKTDAQVDVNIDSFSYGAFVAVWQSNSQDSSSFGIIAQKFDTNGNKIGTEYQVNTYTPGEQSQPQVAVLIDDWYVVTWLSYNQDGSGFGVYAQIYDDNNNNINGEFRVNNNINGDQFVSSVASFKNGNFIITWHSANQDGSGWGIYSQIFNRSGHKIGGELLVNTYTTNDQMNAKVTVLEDDNFVVTWQSGICCDSESSDSRGQDGSAFGIYAQVFDKYGHKIGNEFIVNTYTPLVQANPVVASLGLGEFLITWHSKEQDGSCWGVYGQRYLVDYQIEGDSGNNVLVGGSGNDTLITHGGQDVMTGGIGADTFVVSATNGAFTSNVITDFEVDKDKLDLTSFGAFSLGIEAINENTSRIKMGTNAEVIFLSVSVNQLSDTSFIVGNILPSLTPTLTSSVTNIPSASISSTATVRVSPTTTVAISPSISTSPSVSPSALLVSSEPYSFIYQANQTSVANYYRDWNQYNPIVAKLNNGNTVIAWRDDRESQYTTPDIYDDYFTIIDLNGKYITGDIKVNSDNLKPNGLSSITVLPNGNFIVAFNNVYDRIALYRIFSSSGIPLNNDVIINPSDTPGADRWNTHLEFSLLDDQRMLATYATTPGTGIGGHITGMITDTNGNALSSAFRVTVQSFDDTNPSGDGGASKWYDNKAICPGYAVVTYMFDNGYNVPNAPSFHDIYIRVYNNLGQQLLAHPELIATVADELWPHIVPLNNCEMLISWSEKFIPYYSDYFALYIRKFKFDPNTNSIQFISDPVRVGDYTGINADFSPSIDADHDKIVVTYKNKDNIFTVAYDFELAQISEKTILNKPEYYNQDLKNVLATSGSWSSGYWGWVTTSDQLNYNQCDTLLKGNKLILVCSVTPVSSGGDILYQVYSIANSTTISTDIQTDQNSNFTCGVKTLEEFRGSIDHLTLVTVREQSQISAQSYMPATAALSNGNFVSITLHNNVISGTIYDHYTGFRIADFTVNDDNSAKSYWNGSDYNRVAAGLTNGNFMFAWTARPGSVNNVYVMKLDQLGNRIFSVPAMINIFDGLNHSISSMAAISNDKIVVTWLKSGTTGMMKIINSDGSTDVDQQEIGTMSSPAVAALNDGNFIVTYEKDDYSIHSKIYNTQGQEISALIITTAGIQPDVAANFRGFTVCWQVNSDGSDQGIKCKNYQISQTPYFVAPITNEFWINGFILGNQAEASVLEIRPGIMSVIFHSDNQQNGFYGSQQIRIFDIYGNKLGEIQVTETNLENGYPIISASGNYIFASYSTNQLVFESTTFNKLMLLTEICPAYMGQCTAPENIYNSTTQMVVGINETICPSFSAISTISTTSSPIATLSASSTPTPTATGTISASSSASGTSSIIGSVSISATNSATGRSSFTVTTSNTSAVSTSTTLTQSSIVSATSSVSKSPQVTSTPSPTPISIPSGVIQLGDGNWCVGNKIQFIDMNKDGRQDLVCHKSTIVDDNEPNNFILYANCSNNYISANSDINGKTSLGSGAWCYDSQQLLFADFNGDGYPDLHCFDPEPSVSRNSNIVNNFILLSTNGTSFKSMESSNRTDGGLMLGSGIWCTGQMSHLNANQDEKTDLFCHSMNGDYLMFSTGEGFVPYSSEMVFCPLLESSSNNTSASSSFTHSSTYTASATLSGSVSGTATPTATSSSTETAFVTPSGATLTNGLIAYFPFNGNANDESGYNHKTVISNAQLTSDRFCDTNSAYQFGNSAYSFIEIYNSQLLDIGTSDYSIVVWVKLDIGSNHMRIYSHGSSDCSSGYMIRTEGTKIVREFSCPDYPCIGGALGSTDLIVGVWHLVIQTVQRGGSAKVYIDRALDMEILNTSSCDVSNGSNGFIGFNPSATTANDYQLIEQFHGAIDDVRIYNRALTAGEISLFDTNHLDHC